MKGTLYGAKDQTRVGRIQVSLLSVRPLFYIFIKIVFWFCFSAWFSNNCMYSYIVMLYTVNILSQLILGCIESPP